MKTQSDKAKVFQELHARPRPFLIPNPWDRGSALILESMGFEALATTSLGLANMLGQKDVTLKQVLDNCCEISEATRVKSPACGPYFPCFCGCARRLPPRRPCTSAPTRGQRVTYSSEACEKLGLKDAGPVVDRSTSMPFTSPQPAARKDSAQESAPRPRGDADAGRGGTQITPIVPLLEKLSK